MRRGLLIVGILIGSGCSGSPAAMSGPTARAPAFLFNPINGLTNWKVAQTEFGQYLGVGVVPHGTDIDQSTLDLVGRSVKLKTWPELASVSTKTTMESSLGLVLFKLAPTDPLEDRWYVVVLESVPAGWTSPGRELQLSDGSFGARFKYNSDPTFAGVRYCDKGGGSSVAALFSERIAATPRDVALVQVAYNGAPAPICEDGGQQPPDPRGSYGIVLRCSQLSPDKPMVVSIAPGLKAVSTLAVNGGAPIRIEFVSQGRLDSTGCGYFRP